MKKWILSLTITAILASSVLAVFLFVLPNVKDGIVILDFFKGAEKSGVSEKEIKVWLSIDSPKEGETLSSNFIVSGVFEDNNAIINKIIISLTPPDHSVTYNFDALITNTNFYRLVELSNGGHFDIQAIALDKELKPLSTSPMVYVNTPTIEDTPTNAPVIKTNEVIATNIMASTTVGNAVKPDDISIFRQLKPDFPVVGKELPERSSQIESQLLKDREKTKPKKVSPIPEGQLCVIEAPTNQQTMSNKFNVVGNYYENYPKVDKIQVMISPSDESYTNTKSIFIRNAEFTIPFTIPEKGDYSLWTLTIEKNQSEVTSPRIMFSIENDLDTNKKAAVVTPIIPTNASFDELMQDDTNAASATTKKKKKPKKIKIIPQIVTPTNNQDVYKSFSVSGEFNEQFYMVDRVTVFIAPTDEKVTNVKTIYLRNSNFTVPFKLADEGNYTLWTLTRQKNKDEFLSKKVNFNVVAPVEIEKPTNVTKVIEDRKKPKKKGDKNKGKDDTIKPDDDFEALMNIDAVNEDLASKKEYGKIEIIPLPKDKTYRLYINGIYKGLVSNQAPFKDKLLADANQDVVLRNYENTKEVYKEMMTLSKNETKKIEYNPAGVFNLNLVNLTESAVIKLNNEVYGEAKEGLNISNMVVKPNEKYELNIENSKGDIIATRLIQLEEGDITNFIIDIKSGIRNWFFFVKALEGGPSLMAGVEYRFNPYHKLGLSVGAHYDMNYSEIVPKVDLEYTAYFLGGQYDNFRLGGTVFVNTYLALSGNVQPNISPGVGLRLDIGSFFINFKVRYSFVDKAGDTEFVDKLYPMIGLGFSF